MALPALVLVVSRRSWREQTQTCMHSVCTCSGGCAERRRRPATWPDRVWCIQTGYLTHPCGHRLHHTCGHTIPDPAGALGQVVVWASTANVWQRTGPLLLHPVFIHNRELPCAVVPSSWKSDAKYVWVRAPNQTCGDNSCSALLLTYGLMRTTSQPKLLRAWCTV